MSKRFVPPREAVYDANGLALAGAKLNFYKTGTSTRLETFSDEALTVANSNPVVADAAGRFGDIFLKGEDYKVVLTDAADVTIWTADPVSNLQSIKATGTTTPRSLADRFSEIINVKDFGAVGDGVADDTAAVKAAEALQVPGSFRQIFFPPGNYLITDTITIGQGSQYVGANSRACKVIAGVGLTGKAMFKQSTTEDGHGVMFLNIWIDANDMADYCIHFNDGLFESAYLDNIIVSNAVKDNILSDSNVSTPLAWGRISTFGAGEAGLRMSENQAAVYIENLSGDNNGTALLHIDTPNPQGGYHIASWKSERNALGPGNPVIFKISGASGGFVKIGPGRYFVAGAVSVAGDAIVEIAGSGGNGCFFEIGPISRRVDSPGADYTNGIDNQLMGYTIPVSALHGIIRSFGDPLRHVVGQTSVWPRYVLNNHSVAGENNELRFNHSADGANGKDRVSFYNGATTQIGEMRTSRLWHLTEIGLGGSSISPTAKVLHGTGSPEGAVPANVGSLFVRTDGGTSTTLYVKESGSGSTGWVAK